MTMNDRSFYEFNLRRNKMITSMLLSSIVCTTAFICGYITGKSDEEKKQIDEKVQHIVQFTNDWINRNCK